MVNYRCLFRVGCVIIAVVTCCWPIYQYNLDEHLIQLKFKHFHSAEDRIYPALTLCFEKTTFSQYNESSITNIEDDLMKIDTNHTTLKIEDYVSIIRVRKFDNNIIQFTNRGIGIESQHNEMKNRQIYANTVLRRYQASRCFAIGIPFMKETGINSMDFGIKKSIFAPGNVPTSDEIISGQSKFSIGLSFQNEYFPLLKRSEDGEPPNHLTDNCSGLIFNVRGMEILRRRNKPNDPCYDYVNEGAITVLDAVVNELKCKPHYWNISSPLPDCSENKLIKSRKLLDESLYNYNARHLLKPCRTILDLWYDYDYDHSVGSCTEEDENLHITVVFNDLPFKEISLVPAYTMWNVLSNIAVVLSLFLGFSLIQLPDLFKKLGKRDGGRIGFMFYKKDDINKSIDSIQKEIEILKKDICRIKLSVVKQLQSRQFETRV